MAWNLNAIVRASVSQRHIYKLGMVRSTGEDFLELAGPAAWLKLVHQVVLLGGCGTFKERLLECVSV